MVHHRQHKPSMLQDVEAGRSTEVDAIQGGLLAAAEVAGIQAPLLQACTCLLRGVDQANRLHRTR
jgi:2-dehydropantoate 2-reductase